MHGNFKGVALSLLLIILVVSNSTANSQVTSLLSYFKNTARIRLAETVTVGQVSHLDVDDSGNYLVTDCIVKKVYIFDKRGRFKTELRPDVCHPGFNMAPLKASYKKDATILLLNSLPWGFRFGNEGQCIGGMDRKFTAPIHVAFDAKGGILGYYLGRDQNETSYLCKMDSVGREKFRFGVFPREFRNLLGRVEGGGLITDQQGYAYQANPVEPLIYKYDLQGKLVSKFGKQPSYFHKVEQDISESKDPRSILSDYGKVMKGKSITASLHMLNNNAILVQYYTNKEYGIQIYDLNGNLLNTQEIIVREPIALAKRNQIYIVRQPEPEKNGILPNPLIEVYTSLISSKQSK